MESTEKATKINVSQLTQRFKSKKELHDFLCQDCKAFLPKQEATNVYFLKDILAGKKEYLKREEVLVSSVPQIDGLSMEDFLKYAKQNPKLLKFLPEEKDWLHLDKRWICDLLYSLDPEGIQSFIDKALSKRKAKIEEKQDLLVQMRPEFVKALETSLSFSTSKGKSAYLMKPSSKRKRTRAEMEEEKKQKEELKSERESFLSSKRKYEGQMQQKDQKIKELLGYESLIHQLHDSGVIDERGKLIRDNNEPNIIENEDMSQ